jgi:hypothetical protein
MVDVYRLTPFFNEETRREWPDSPNWVIEGKLEEHLVVSVPVDTSFESLQRIYKQLEQEFNMPVCVVTHNMEFMVAQRLSRGEATRALKRIEDYAEDRRQAFEKEIASIQAKARGDQTAKEAVGDE